MQFNKRPHDLLNMKRQVIGGQCDKRARCFFNICLFAIMKKYMLS